MLRLFGVKIHHDYHSEAKVFATLLRHRENRYEAQVLYNGWRGDSQGSEKFNETARTTVLSMDTGWRPNSDRRRSIAERLTSVARIRLSMLQALSQAKRFRPDVVYSSQQTWDNLTARFLAERLQKPHVIHLHYVPEMICPTNRFQIQAVQNLKNSHSVITVSEFIRERVISHGAFPERVYSLMNTIAAADPPLPETRLEVRQELGMDADSPLIGIIGRVEKWKGQPDTLEAFAKIAARFPEAHLLIAGTGDYLETAKADALQRPCSDRVHLLGSRSDVPRLLGALDVFSHPSRFDPAPLAVLEACAAGLPVVAYAEGGVCEMIVEGETGFLVSPENVEGLASAFETLLRNPERARQMGRANRERMKARFRPEDAGQKFADLLQTIGQSRLREAGTEPKKETAY